MDKTKIHLFTGGYDQVAVVADTERLARDLPVKPQWTFLEEYDHLDFVWGRDAFADVYRPIIASLNEAQAVKVMSMYYLFRFVSKLA
jgi:hypothetical protein